MGLETIWKKLRGQGSFEYILLLAGVLLIVVLAVVLLRGQSTGSGEEAAWQQCKTTLAQDKLCYKSDGNWEPAGVVPLTQRSTACVNYMTKYQATNMLNLVANACSSVEKAYNNNGLCCGATPR